MSDETNALALSIIEKVQGCLYNMNFKTAKVRSAQVAGLSSRFGNPTYDVSLILEDGAVLTLIYSYPISVEAVTF